MFLISNAGGFLSAVVAASAAGAEGEALCSAVGFAASLVALDFFGGFASKGSATSKPVIRRQIGLNIGKGTSKPFRCSMAKQLERASLAADIAARTRWPDGIFPASCYV